jgi:hypothetical protein
MVMRSATSYQSPRGSCRQCRGRATRVSNNALSLSQLLLLTKLFTELAAHDVRTQRQLTASGRLEPVRRPRLSPARRGRRHVQRRLPLSRPARPSTCAASFAAPTGLVRCVGTPVLASSRNLDSRRATPSSGRQARSGAAISWRRAGSRTCSVGWLGKQLGGNRFAGDGELSGSLGDRFGSIPGSFGSLVLARARARVVENGGRYAR